MGYMDSSIEQNALGNLQSCLYAGLRTALGCVKMTSVDHLHAEAKIMPVKNHCNMITKQFLLATQKPEHPNQSNILAPRPLRAMKNIIKESYSTNIQHLVQKDGISDVEYNKVLNSSPPHIH